jgi:hypothetical protein
LREIERSLLTRSAKKQRTSYKESVR